MDDFQNSTYEYIEIRCNNIIAICRNVAFGGGGFQVEVRNIVDSVIKSNYNLSFKNNSISKIASSAVINLYKCKEKENETECKQTVSNTNENAKKILLQP